MHPFHIWGNREVSRFVQGPTGGKNQAGIRPRQPDTRARTLTSLLSLHSVTPLKPPRDYSNSLQAILKNNQNIKKRWISKLEASSKSPSPQISSKMKHIQTCIKAWRTGNSPSPTTVHSKLKNIPKLKSFLQKWFSVTSNFTLCLELKFLSLILFLHNGPRYLRRAFTFLLSFIFW